MANKKRKSGGILSNLFGAAALAGAAAAVSKLEKQAKEEGKDILEVDKEKVDKFVEDVKSGEAVNKVTDFAEKTVNTVTSEDFVENVKEKVNETVEGVKESVKSGEFAEKAKDVAANVKDGVIDIFDGKEEKVAEDVETVVEEVAEAVENTVEDTDNTDSEA